MYIVGGIFMDLASILTQIDDVLYTWLLIYLLAGSGIYFSIRTRFVQIRREAIVDWAGRISPPTLSNC